MRRSHSSNPIGKRYNEAFAVLGHPTPQLAAVNKTDRAQFVWCYKNRTPIEKWWDTVAQNQRDRWGHPDTIKKQYLKAHGDSGVKPTAGGGGLKAENARLQRAEGDMLLTVPAMS